MKRNRPIKLLKKEDVIYLWHIGYYDGPLSGVCLYQGELYYFNVEKENWSSRPRTEKELQEEKKCLGNMFDPEIDSRIVFNKIIYYLYELTDEEYHILFSNHAVFNHCKSLSSTYLYDQERIYNIHKDNEILTKIKNENYINFKPKLKPEKIKYAIYLKGDM